MFQKNFEAPSDICQMIHIPECQVLNVIFHICKFSLEISDMFYDFHQHWCYKEVSLYLPCLSTWRLGVIFVTVMLRYIIHE